MWRFIATRVREGKGRFYSVACREYQLVYFQVALLVVTEIDFQLYIPLLR